MKRLFFTFLVFGTCLSIQAQTGFKGSAILGINFAQIDGDGLAGYDKPGISAGFRLSYPLEKRMDLSLEMLYSTRGSQENLFGGGDAGLGTTNLRYIELPIIYSFKDWFIEGENYHKVKAEGGLSLGYLFDVESENTTYIDGIGNLTEYDLSYILGVSYNATRNIGFTFRYTRSLVDLYQLEGRLLSYFITFRTDYNF